MLFSSSAMLVEKASSFGLRKKKYIKEIKVMIFNLELIPFMDLETARNFYNLVIKNIPKNDKFDKFLEYFQNTLFIF